MTEMLIVLDTETTGLPKDLSSDVRPVSFGAAAYFGPQMEEVDSTHFLLRPDVWADGWERAEAIHGLDRGRMDRDGLTMKDGWDRAVKWMHAAAKANQVNIADMSLSRDKESGKALTLLTLDSTPGAEVLAELGKIEGISAVHCIAV